MQVYERDKIALEECKLLPMGWWNVCCQIKYGFHGFIQASIHWGIISLLILNWISMLYYYVWIELYLILYSLSEELPLISWGSLRILSKKTHIRTKLQAFQKKINKYSEKLYKRWKTLIGDSKLPPLLGCQVRQCIIWKLSEILLPQWMTPIFCEKRHSTLHLRWFWVSN